MPVNPWPPALGNMVTADGCITRLRSVINQPSDEIERRIGYSAGRLDGGWWLLLLMDSVQAGEFEFFGYSNSSGGRSGHPQEGDGRETVEASLRGMLTPSGFRKKQEEIAAGMASSGPDRIAKILPRSGEDPTIPASEAWRHYPPGSGIPQWRLTVAKQFVVAADIPDGRVFRGGGAGFWLDPKRAQTMGN
jgi:hypothetical protein